MKEINVIESLHISLLSRRGITCSKASKMLHVVLFVSCAFMISSTKAEKCSPPAQQESPYTVSHTGLINEIPSQGLQWQIKLSISSSYVPVCTCHMKASPKCDPCKVNGYTATIKATQNGYQSDFTITDVTRDLDNASLLWFISEKSLGPCNLEVFDFRSNATCSASFQVENTGTANNPNVHVVCDISNVFPEPRCEFKQTGTGQESVPSKYVTENTAITTDSGNALTYSRRCSMIRPVTDLVPGQYTFQVSMYPDVITDGEKYGNTATSSLDLSIPKPTCDQPRLANSNTDVTVTCRVASVYPRMKCDFYKLTGTNNAVRVGNQQDSVSPCTNNPATICDHQCTLTVSVSSLGPGHHKFKVSMGIDGLGDSVDSDLTGSIHLSYPAPGIANCPKGQQDYIKQGTTATCECTMLTSGNPPGRVQWVTSDNTTVGTQFNGVKTTLAVSYNPNDRNPVYYCQAVSNLGQGPRKSYSPKFAYGPETITDFVLPSPYNVCPSTTDPISITCDVDQNTVNPKPNVVIKGLDTNLLQSDRTTTESGKYRFHFSFRPNTGQKLTARCVASNAIFPELSQEAIREISVQKPPPSPPAMSTDSQPPIQDGQSVNVISGQPVQVQCNVQGGFPPVTKVKLTCAGNKYETEGTQLTQSITLDKTNNNDSCSCTAVHPSGCYDKSTQFTFNVLYGPESVTPTINTPTVKLCPSKTDNIEMYCDVPKNGVNPKPSVMVKGLNKDKEPTSDTVVSHNYRFQFSFPPVKGGKLTVRCVATNPLVSSLTVGADAMVTVLQPPPLPPAMSTDSQSTIQDGHSVNVISGQPVQVQCNVQGGFPPVTKVKLTCAGRQYETEETNLTQSITLNKTNNSDPCSCTAVHLSDCYDKSTQFTFNVQYESRVTKYTLTTHTQQVIVEDGSNTNNSNSFQLEVNAGTKVTFVCEGEGNPRPDVKVKSQTSLPIPSYVTPSDDYLNKTMTTKTMTCRDTAFYVCEASNGIGVSSNETVLILIKCAPELPDPDNGIITYHFVNGTDLEIGIIILGHPAPNKYILTRSTTRPKRSTDGEEVGAHRYNVTFTQQDELYGRVTLQMYRMTDNDNGQYELDIQNGVGDGLKYSFNVDIKEESPGSALNVGAIVGGIVAAIIVVIIIFVCCLLYKKGLLPKCSKGKSPQSRPCVVEEEDIDVKHNVLYADGKDVQASVAWSKNNHATSNSDSNIVTLTNDIYNMDKPGYSHGVASASDMDQAASSDEVVIQNDIYGTGPDRDSDVVVIQNDIYGTNPDRDSTEVTHTNVIYGTVPPMKTEEPVYRDYTTVKPTITSASTLPKNVQASNSDLNRVSDNPYEDLEADGSPGASLPVATVTPKPKPSVPSKPKKLSVTRNDGNNQPMGGQVDDDNVYSSVVKDKNSQRDIDNPYNNTEEVELFPLQSNAPIIPEKSFNTKVEKEMKKKQEKERKAQDKEKKKSSRKSKLQSSKRGGEEGQAQPQPPTPPYSYSNQGLDMEDEENPYTNAV